MVEKKTKQKSPKKPKITPTLLSKVFKDKALAPRPNQHKNKVGRKTLFKPFMLEEGYKLGALGFSMDEIAAFWNVSVRALSRWSLKNIEFRPTIKRGRDEADNTVLESLLIQAKLGNMTGIIFWLKNRHPDKWRDKREFSGAVQHEHIHFFNEMLEKADEVDDWEREVDLGSINRIADRATDTKDD